MSGFFFDGLAAKEEQDQRNSIEDQLNQSVASKDKRVTDRNTSSGKSKSSSNWNLVRQSMRKSGAADRDTRTTGADGGTRSTVRQKCARFVSKAAAPPSTVKTVSDYVPKVEAKVRRTWYTRRDQDGNVCLVQVEEGIDDEAEPDGSFKKSAAFRPHRAGAPEEVDRKKDMGLRSSLKGLTRKTNDRNTDTDAPAADTPVKDPFRDMLEQTPVYIHPLSMFMRIWDALVLLICSAYMVILVPMRIAFPHVWPTPTLVILDCVCSALLFVEVFLRFFVAYEDNDADMSEDNNSKARMYSSTNQDAHLVVDRSRIVGRHLRGRFWLSLLAALPIELLVFVATGSNWAASGGDEDIDFGSGLASLPPSMLEETCMAAYFGLSRLACVAHLAHFFDRWEWSAVDHTILDRILKNLMVGAFGAHWLACGFVYVARRSEIGGHASHLSAPKELAFYAEVESVGVGAQYARAIYWALTTMSGVGYGDITPHSIGETFYAAFAVSVGTSFFFFTVGSVTSLIMSSDAVHAQVKARLGGLKKWMSRAGLPPEMRVRVLENFYDQHVTRMGVEDRNMLAELPKFLQHEVAMYLNKDIVKSTALFRGCSATLVASIVEHLHAHRCLPLDIVIHKGDVADELYLVKRGLFEAINEDGSVHRMLGAGSYFGEVALLCRIHRTMTVRAVTMGLVFVVERQHFEKLMDEYPADRNQLLLSAALRYRTKAKPGYYLSQNARAHSRTPSMIPFHGSMNKLGSMKGSCSSMFNHQSMAGGSRRASTQAGSCTAGISSSIARGWSPEKRRSSELSSGRGGGVGSGRFAKRVISSARLLADVADFSRPLAFMSSSNADIESLKFNHKLLPMKVSEAEKVSVAADAQVVVQLRQEANNDDRRTSIGIAGDDETRASERGRKSMYAVNRAKLEDALDKDDGSESFAVSPPMGASPEKRDSALNDAYREDDGASTTPPSAAPPNRGWLGLEC